MAGKILTNNPNISERVPKGKNDEKPKLVFHAPVYTLCSCSNNCTATIRLPSKSHSKMHKQSILFIFDSFTMFGSRTKTKMWKMTVEKNMKKGEDKYKYKSTDKYIDKYKDKYIEKMWMMMVKIKSGKRFGRK